MEFELSSLIITIIAFLAFVIPVSIDQLTKKKKAQTVKILTQFAERQKVKLSKKEVFQNIYAFGLDNSLKELIYVNNGNAGTVESYTLSNYSKCSQHKESIKSSDSKFTGVTYLRLTPKNSSQPQVDLEMFKTKANLANTEEEGIAKKLIKAVNQVL